VLAKQALQVPEPQEGVGDVRLSRGHRDNGLAFGTPTVLDFQVILLLSDCLSRKGRDDPLSNPIANASTDDRASVV